MALARCSYGAYGVHMDTNPNRNDTVPGLIESQMRKADRTRKWTADRAGIPETTFRRKLRGGADFTVSEVARIARALGIAACDLLPAEFRAEAAA